MRAALAAPDAIPDANLIDDKAHPMLPHLLPHFSKALLTAVESSRRPEGLNQWQC